MERDLFALHVGSVFTFTTLLLGSLGTLLIWLWRRDPGQKALAYWGISRLAGTGAMVLLALRGIVPDWVSIDIANAIVCVSYGLTWAGARAFEGRPSRPVLVASGAILWLLACRVPQFYAHVEWRVALAALTLATYNLAAAIEFHRGRARNLLPSRPLLVILLTIGAATFGVCGMLALLLPFRATGVALPNAAWFAMLVSLGIALVVSTTILVVVLTKELAELRSTSALAAARDLANEASAQKTRFLARMSHELRTPLNGVLGLAQILAHDPELGERQHLHAATLEQAGQHLLAILNEVLDLTRIEAGRLDLSPRPVLLADFLRDTVALVAGAAESGKVMLHPVSSASLPEAVQVDPMRLRQILLNLLNNALKFTPPGGSVTFLAECDEPAGVRFIITDTGRGVPQALRGRLFQDYTQALGGEASGGTGLGLAISASLAQAMGGTLAHADGPEGAGSCFTLTLPLPSVPRPPVAKQALVPPPLPSGLRILVVDDVALNRRTARAMLEHAGRVVNDAEDGPSALAAVTREPLPDVVLMDQSMPGMDGNTAARRIRTLGGPAARLPIVAVTANALPEDVEASFAAGMDGHVSKPIEMKSLLTAIAQAMDRAAVREWSKSDGEYRLN